MNWDQVSGEVGALMQRYAALPRHIAKKHLIASMKRAMRPAVPALRAATPVGRVLKANKKGVVKMRRSGALRRAATAKAAYKGRNADGIVIGAVGYKYGPESRKAIWLEFGTKSGVVPRGIVAGVMRSEGGRIASRITEEMAAALEKATNEVAAGKNRGYGK